MGVLLTFGLCLLVGLLKTGGFSWASVWWMWLLIGLVLLLLYVAMRRSRYSAGADWLMGRQRWVRTYELTKVKASRAPAAIVLKLVDSGGRFLRVKVMDLQRNPELWALVLDGILHSLRDHRVEINRLAWDELFPDGDLDALISGLALDEGWATTAPQRKRPWGLITGAVVLSPLYLLGVWRITQEFLGGVANAPEIGWGISVVVFIASVVWYLRWRRANHR